MCGLLFTNNEKITKEDFLRALSSMEHRGPDVVQCFQNSKKNKFGHNRLKILDLDNRSNQPMKSKNNRFIMIFNGEVYNYKELAKEYKLKISTTSDSEVLLELFNLLGPKMLDKLNGMFALVIYDTKNNELFVARDRLGIKPLYIYEENNKVIISSEIDSILELVDNYSWDEVGIRQYKKLRTFFNGRTIYNEIKMFPAGYYMINNKKTRYWQLSYEPNKSPPKDDELIDLIQSAVDYRCLSDVPVGSYLSGGVDSTLIAALSNKPHTWTVGFPDKNEFIWGRLGAEYISSNHKEVLIEYSEFCDIAKKMILKRKEPLSVPNEVLLYKMTKAVKEKNTVVLSGEGADELFFGYDRIYRWANENNWDLKEFDKHYSYGSINDDDIIFDAIQPFMLYTETIDIISHFFQIAHLHGLLRRLDNSTMLCSVEARVPFVDHRLIDRMAGVPFAYKMKDGIVKEPLKRIFNKYLPNEIIERKKIGFPVPLAKIFGIEKSPMDSWLDFNLETLGID